MGTKIAVAFANIFMAKVEMEILNQSALKTVHLETIYWRHIFPLDFKQRGDNAVHWASKQTPPHTITFMAEISETETTFLVQTFKKAKDSEAIQFLMCVRTSKARLWDFSEQTILKNIWRAHSKS